MIAVILIVLLVLLLVERPLAWNSAAPLGTVVTVLLIVLLLVLLLDAVGVASWRFR